jgi:hypothetical protein
MDLGGGIRRLGAVAHSFRISTRMVINEEDKKACAVEITEVLVGTVWVRPTTTRCYSFE